MAEQPLWVHVPLFLILEIVNKHTKGGRSILDEWSALYRDLYLITNSNHKRENFKLTAGFEPATLSSERPQTHVLDSAATGICKINVFWINVTWSQVKQTHIPHVIIPRKRCFFAFDHGYIVVSFSYLTTMEEAYAAWSRMLEWAENK